MMNGAFVLFGAWVTNLVPSKEEYIEKSAAVWAADSLHIQYFIHFWVLSDFLQQCFLEAQVQTVQAAHR